jgi:hypothetical protein
MLDGDSTSKLRVALVILGDALLFVALIMMLAIDQLVNGTLYYHGLIFNNAWAQPYWLMFKVGAVAIIAAIFLISLVELPHPAFEDKD